MKTAIYDDDREDTGKGARQVVLRSVAGAAPRPKTTAPASVFAAAKAARRKRVYLDPDAVLVRDNVPIPPISPRGFVLRGSPYAALFSRMAVGQMVELTGRHAASFIKWGKTHAPGQLLRRHLRDGVTGVWRVEPGSKE